jgi:hypothetical protein
MASISLEVVIESSADDVWKVIGEFATGPSRMAPGFVVDTQSEGDFRTVTFADGTVVTERCIGVDEQARRIAYSIVGGSVEPLHDNASMQAFPYGEGSCRLVWTRDVLPDGLAAPIADSMSRGLEVIKRTLEKS